MDNDDIISLLNDINFDNHEMKSDGRSKKTSNSNSKNNRGYQKEYLTSVSDESESENSDGDNLPRLKGWMSLADIAAEATIKALNRGTQESFDSETSESSGDDGSSVYDVEIEYLRSHNDKRRRANRNELRRSDEKKMTFQEQRESSNRLSHPKYRTRSEREHEICNGINEEVEERKVDERIVSLELRIQGIYELKF